MRYILKIPNPCEQDWAKMTPTEKGMFCNTCKKEVFDLTNFSNYQLAKRLDTNKNICGRFKKTQIDKELNSSKNINVSRFGIILGLSSFISISQPIYSQNKKERIEIKDKQEELSTTSVSKESFSDKIVIRGNITDSNKYPLPGVTIILKGKSIGTQTNLDGNFSLEIPIEYLENKSKLVLTYLGFEPKEISINKKTELINTELTESEDILMGEVIIIKRQNIFRRIGNIFRKKEKKNHN